MFDLYADKSMLALYNGETSLCLISLCLFFFPENSTFHLNAGQGYI